ncbi:MAG: hypothetical protein CMQ22_08065 [Gammaproteobacteria bacterium]|nr:hypothetical protein [Gammaproteobacteria bacterium]
MNRLFAFVNPFVVSLARSFLHPLVSHQVVVLAFNGRRSGRRYAIPVSFLRSDDEVLCLTARDGVWWRNLQEAAPVQLTLGGQSLQATAYVEVENEQQIRSALRLFCLRSRISAYFSSVAIDANGEPDELDLSRSARQHVLIKLSIER